MKTRLLTLITVGVLGLSVAAPAQMLLKNRTFDGGPVDWITAENQYNAAAAWIAYNPLSGDALAAAQTFGTGSATLKVYVDTGANVVQTENLLYQEFPKATYNFKVGDVIHFSGDYTATVAANPDFVLVYKIFIKANSPSYDPLAWGLVDTSTISNEVGTHSGSFNVSLTIANAGNLSALGNIQIGVAVYGDDTNDQGTLTVSNLKGWLNDDMSEVATTWAGYTIGPDGWVDTGSFLGVIYPMSDWVWSANLGTWIYLPEAWVDTSGTWAYVLKP